MTEYSLSFKPSGDNGILITFGEEISVETHNRIRSFMAFFEDHKEEYQIIEMIPAYTTILMIYDPLKINYKELCLKLQKVEGKYKDISKAPREVIQIPVVYGGSYGPDLESVASHNNLTVEEIIKIHTGGRYLIYMMGFTPGFPYLGGMSEKIATPRLTVPREKIIAGSVGIAGSQTGIYPIDSPGGWQIIGRTPLQLFNPLREEVTLFKAGQYLSFYSISEEDFIRISKEVLENTYKVQKTTFKEVEDHD
ncbi:5-oxoprolinase subunit PxpB [Alkaliphilus serpentinus]|uniref:5-oxoprolinase subunit PxpB n=1 Tax=Alkaliphilus serpentinus TaxID=1482731 RepID=A0A833HQ77_9FIRM|nr:5-oxoprolinase subunit PxpB [Alkaliphilus serpentinus]KAB3531497.1 5-oxoprolinase subunit PxpB [Alkaliphilus serpentinus]